MIYKRYGNVNTIMWFRVYVRCLFLCSCLPVILGTETVAPILSASLDASSNHSWHSSSMFDLTLATALIVSSIIEYARKTPWSFFWSLAATGLSVVDQLRKQRQPRVSQSVNTDRRWRRKYCFASRGEQIIRGYPKAITFLNIPGIQFNGKMPRALH